MMDKQDNVLNAARALYEEAKAVLDAAQVEVNAVEDVHDEANIAYDEARSAYDAAEAAYDDAETAAVVAKHDEDRTVFTGTDGDGNVVEMILVADGHICIIYCGEDIHLIAPVEDEHDGQVQVGGTTVNL